MDLNLLIITVALLAALTLGYKLLPHRVLGERKPAIALLPKYRKAISVQLDQAQLESKLASFGFTKSGSKNGFVHFTRGSVLGDFSVKLMKVRVGIREPSNGASEVTVEAGWLAAFDTGDFWQFTNELAERLENA